jgi:hypothetical protein
MRNFDVSVTYTVSAETEDQARDSIQSLLDGHLAEIDYIEEIVV